MEGYNTLQTEMSLFIEVFICVMQGENNEEKEVTTDNILEQAVILALKVKQTRRSLRRYNKQLDHDLQLLKNSFKSSKSKVG